MISEIVHRSFWEITKRFLSPFGSHYRIYMVAMSTYLLSTVNVIAYVLFMERVLFVLESWTKSDFYKTMYIFLAYYVVYIFLKIVLRKYWWPAHSSTARKYIQRKYLPRFFRLNNNDIERLGTGKIVAILDKGITIWGQLFHRVFEQWIQVIISVFFTAYMVGKNSTTLLWVFVLLYIIIYICSFYFNMGTIKHRRKRLEWGNTYTKHLVKLIMSKNEVLFTSRGHSEIDKLDFYLDNKIYYNKKMTNFLMPMFELPRIIITWLLVFTLYYFWGLYLEWQLTISEVAWLSAAFIVMLNAINTWVKFFKDFTKEFTEVEKFWNFFDTTPEIEWYEEWKTFIHKNGDIHIQNISYSYENTSPVFQNFSLDIPGSKITALVWPSGGGKSTLVKLISGYIRQDSGDIIVDNQNLREVSLKSYYTDVGYLTQEPSVFDGTVEENLLYAVSKPLPTSHWKGEEQATVSSLLNKEEVERELNIQEVIRLAHCEFIYDLPNGLQTEIGERGIKLSGGQKQRLAIAKIFLKDPKIIILDEPTSALDSLSEQKITEAMHNLFQGRTVVIIAHRLQTVKHADDIIVIESGKIVERGTHTSLIAKRWYYKEMLDLQSGF